MIQEDAVQKILDSISSPDIKSAASTAALVMSYSTGPAAKAAAKMTFASLHKFSREYSDMKDRTVSKAESPLDEEPVSETLGAVVRESGCYYFGPMFDCQQRLTIDRFEVLSGLSNMGFLVEAMSRMDDVSLDMFYTRSLELGLG